MRNDRKRQAAMERHRMRRKAHVKALRRHNAENRGWTDRPANISFRRLRI